MGGDPPEVQLPLPSDLEVELPERCPCCGVFLSESEVSGLDDEVASPPSPPSWASSVTEVLSRMPGWATPFYKEHYEWSVCADDSVEELSKFYTPLPGQAVCKVWREGRTSAPFESRAVRMLGDGVFYDHPVVISSRVKKLPSVEGAEPLPREEAEPLPREEAEPLPREEAEPLPREEVRWPAYKTLPLFALQACELQVTSVRPPPVFPTSTTAELPVWPGRGSETFTEYHVNFNQGWRSRLDRLFKSTPS